MLMRENGCLMNAVKPNEIGRESARVWVILLDRILRGFEAGIDLET